MFCIDRFEEEFAVCQDENGQSRLLPRSAFPETTKEGDWFSESTPNVFVFLPEETQIRRDAVAARLKALLNR